jgi:hypothetical protein
VKRFVPALGFAIDIAGYNRVAGDLAFEPEGPGSATA